MRIITFIVFGTGIVVLAAVGAVWAISMMMPFAAFIGIVVFVVVRSNRRAAARDAALLKEIERQRLLNDQEYTAWRHNVDDARRKDERRRRALRKFDDSRNPPIG